MQTNFTAAALADPQMAESESIVRKCVHCGFCTATCPTYVLLGDELDSPRGRIVLIKDMLEAGRPATQEVVKHVDRCLSCLACVTTCPSGVDYRHLVDHARAHIERTYRRPWSARLLRASLAAVLPYPNRLRAALAVGRLARPFARWLPRAVQPLLKLVPEPDARGYTRGSHGARGQRRLRVALLTGCAQDVLTPRVHAATIRLLTRAGAEVVTIGGCCGSLTHHLGREDSAKAFARNLIASLVQERGHSGLDAVVADASGCGLHVKDYGHLFRDDPIAADAAAVSAMARDVTEIVSTLGLPPVTKPEPTVVEYQSPCSMQHGQKIDALPRELLRAAGYDVREIGENHLCCGSAGTYNLLQPDLADRLRSRKLDNIRRTGAKIVATGNVGCAMQLGVDGEFTVLHTVELLDRATRGPEEAS
ncbi:MAG: glycolate oxidase subunit GlcF [Steroidobacteraceae bacterium]